MPLFESSSVSTVSTALISHLSGITVAVPGRSNGEAIGFLCYLRLINHRWWRLHFASPAITCHLTCRVGDMNEATGKSMGSAVPISVDRRVLAGEGLSAGDLSEFDDEGVMPEDEAPDFRTHNFHTGNIMVSVYEAGPGKVRIEGSVYDECITIQIGRAHV